jgi:hypothetical protein
VCFLQVCMGGGACHAWLRGGDSGGRGGDEQICLI